MKVKETCQRSTNPLASPNAELTQQQFEESAQAALDVVCRSDAQTYDQFMSNFTHLTPDDVKRGLQSKSATNTEDHWHPPEVKAKLPLLGSVGAEIMTEQQQTSQVKEEIRKSDLKGQSHTKRLDQDAMDEEVLEEGVVTQSYLMRTDDTKSLKVKLGNFVEEEDSCSEDEASYLPSFSADKEISVTETSSNKGPAVNIHQNQAQILVAKDNSFTKPPNDSKQNDATGRTTNSMDLKPPISDSENAARIMVAACLKTEDHNNSEENILDLIGVDDSLSEDSDLEYDATLDLPNPGEIVEQKDTIVKDFVTKLNFTAHVADNQKVTQGQKITKKKRRGKGGHSVQNAGSEGPMASHAQEITQTAQCEEVEAFSLDNHFDYDNVVLSPKYNAEEMAILLNAMKATSTEQAAAK